MAPSWTFKHLNIQFHKLFPKFSLNYPKKFRNVSKPSVTNYEIEKLDFCPNFHKFPQISVASKQKPVPHVNIMSFPFHCPLLSNSNSPPILIECN